MATTRRAITHQALELGHGFTTILDRLEANHAELPEDTQYYGVDNFKIMTNGVDPRKLPGIRRHYTETQRRIKAHPRTKLFTMNANNLTFPDNHFDSVHMVNFLNSSQFRSRNKRNTELAKTYAEECIREARRVLKPGGHLLIVHDLKDVKTDGLERITAVGGFTNVTGEPNIPTWFAQIPINLTRINPIAQWPPLVRIYRKN